MHRRDHLKRLAHLGAGLLLPGLASSRAYAVAGATDTRFLLVFLRGGYDAANVLLPSRSSIYYDMRPTIAVRPPIGAAASPDPQAGLALTGGGDWALHPSLGPGLVPLWERQQLAFVPFAGTDDLTRSHFETQDSIEAGLPQAGDRSTAAGPPALRGSGFLNRLAGVLGGRAAPVAFTDGLPAVFAGPGAVPNVSLRGAGRAPFDARQTQLFASMYHGTRFESLIHEGFELRQTVAQEAEAIQMRDRAQAQPAAGRMDMAGGETDVARRMQEMDASNRRALSARGFEVEARRMAALMRDRFNLGFIDVGGWDTHVNQGGAQGQLANLLENLGRGVAGFAEEIGPAWAHTVVVVVSEFGRTFRENGTRGTDHGHGSTYWVAGGAVRGGRVVGEQVAVEARNLHQSRDFPVLNEYRAVLGGLFARMYGLDAARLAQVFPGVQPQDLGLL